MIIGAFATEEDLIQAVVRLTNRGLGPIETHSPAPPEAKHSMLTLIMLVAGLLGAAGGFALQAYATGVAYPIDIGGRPDVFWPSYIPFTLETGLMSAMLVGFVGFLIVNRMPTLYDRIDDSQAFHRASLDMWFLAIQTEDPNRISRAMELLRPLSPVRLEVLPS